MVLVLVQVTAYIPRMRAESPSQRYVRSGPSILTLDLRFLAFFLVLFLRPD